MTITFKKHIAFNFYETLKKDFVKIVKAGTNYEVYFIVTFKDNTIERISAKDIIEIG